MTLMGLLVMLAVFGLMWWASTAIMAGFKLPEQVQVLVKVALVILFVVYILGALFGKVPALNVPIRVG